MLVIETAYHVKHTQVFRKQSQPKEKMNRTYCKSSAHTVIDFLLTVSKTNLVTTASAFLWCLKCQLSKQHSTSCCITQGILRLSKFSVYPLVFCKVTYVCIIFAVFRLFPGPILPIIVFFCFLNLVFCDYEYGIVLYWFIF